MYTHYTCIYTILTPLNTLYTPYIHPIYTVQSPRFLVGMYVDDWREGMEEYARSIAVLHPALSHKAPSQAPPIVGWNSWGSLQFSTNLGNYEAAADVLKSLQAPAGGGFAGMDGQQYVNPSYCKLILLHSLYSCPLYTCMTIYTPMYTRYTCVFTPYMHRTHPPYTPHIQLS